MASLTSISHPQTQSFLVEPKISTRSGGSLSLGSQSFKIPKIAMSARTGGGGVVVVSATTAEKSKKRYPGEAKGFVEEMRFVAMKLHTREQAREGEKEVKEPEERPVTKWEPTVDGYLRFLVDSKLVYDTLETIIQQAPIPSCEFLLIFPILLVY